MVESLADIPTRVGDTEGEVATPCNQFERRGEDINPPTKLSTKICLFKKMYREIKMEFYQQNQISRAHRVSQGPSQLSGSLQWV